MARFPRSLLVLGSMLAVLGVACRPSTEIRPAFTREARMPHGSLEGTILFTGRADDDNALFAFDAGERRTRPLLGAARSPALSPDGSQLAYAVASGPEAGIYTASPEGRDRRALVRSEGFFDSPAWSADGSRLAYAFLADTEDHWNLYLLDAAGGEPQQLTDSEGHDWLPTWSPDGSQIAFTSDRDGENTIWVLTIDSGDERKVVESAGENREPAWSPDGASILFSSNRDLDRWQLFVYDVETGETRNLLRTTGMDRFPTWSPDGQYILVSIGYLAAYRADGERFPDGSDRWQLTERLATTSTWR